MKIWGSLYKKIGKPPGTLVYTGSHVQAATRVDLLQYNPEEYHLEKELLQNHQSFVLGNDVLVSFHEKDTALFDSIVDRITGKKGKVRERKNDYLAYLLIDQIVDNYFLYLYDLERDISTAEEELLEGGLENSGEYLIKLKKRLIFLRKNILPVREEFMKWDKTETGLVEEKTWLYLQDVADHLEHLAGGIESFSELVTGLFDLHLSQASMATNKVMQTLTIIATLFIPLTFIAGIYGMNFEYMPELQWKWGYPAVMGFMFLSAIVMLLWMKKKKWM